MCFFIQLPRRRRSALPARKAYIINRWSDITNVCAGVPHKDQHIGQLRMRIAKKQNYGAVTAFSSALD